MTTRQTNCSRVLLAAVRGHCEANCRMVPIGSSPDLCRVWNVAVVCQC